jgi:hypothetical protein
MRSACVLGLAAAVPAVVGLHAPEAQRRVLFDSQGRRLAGTTANAVSFGANSFLSVHVGSVAFPYASTATGIAMPVSVNEYALTGGAAIQSIPLPSVESNGYSACTLAKGVGSWDYNYDGMPQPSGNGNFWMIPCYNVPAGSPITATSPRVIAIMASNGIYEVFNSFLPAGGSAPGFRYVASITGFTNYYLAFGQNTTTGVHFLPTRSTAQTTQFCAPTYTGCGDELRGLSLYSTYPSYVSGSLQYQLHTADRRRSGLFRAIPSGGITPINTTASAAVAPWGNYMEPLPAVLNTTEMISAMAFGEDSTRIYLALEDTAITIQGVTSTPKSSGARYYFVAATGTTAARWDQQAVAVISDTSPALWSFFPRLRGGGTKAYYSTLDNKLIVLDYSPTPVNTQEVVFADFPAGAKMRAAHLPPAVSRSRRRAAAHGGVKREG